MKKILPKKPSVLTTNWDSDPGPLDPMILIDKLAPETLFVKLDDPELMPYKKHDTDAGWDLRAAENYDIYPGKVIMANTGIKIAIPTGNVGLLIPRSSTGANGLILKNTVGVIDADYRGYIKCVLQNTSGRNIFIQKYERFVQLVLLPIPTIKTEIVEELPITERGENGFGASGKI